jgi:ABC-type branched-subunit amino acid transport system substrate-binding protein
VTGARVPIISLVSTSPWLSDGKRYPYFLRTIPSFALGFDGELDVMLQLFNYTSVALAASDEVYANLGGSQFAAAAASRGLAISSLGLFAASATDFTAPLNVLQRSGARIILLASLGAGASRFMQAALAIGVGGEGYLWFAVLIAYKQTRSLLVGR